MANWQSEIINAEEIERTQKAPLHKPFGAYMSTVSSVSEEGTFSYYATKGRTIPITHPYVSATSWFRCMPETGTAFVAQFRADEARPQLITTFQRGAKGRLEAYVGDAQSGTGVYRPLAPGEIDLTSAGMAQAFYTRRAKYQHRAGMLERWSDQDRLECGDRAPIHKKQLFNHSADDIVDEYRLGIVSRPKDAWQVSFPKYNGFYAAEEYLNLKNPLGALPTILYSRQHGHVLDKKGLPIKQTVTKLPLRSKTNYYAADDSATTFEVDELGNAYFETGDSAVRGYELNITQGSYKRIVALNESVTVNGNRSDSVGLSSSYSVKNSYQLSVESGAVFNMVTSEDLIDFETGSGNSFSMSPSKGIVANEISGCNMTLNQGEVDLQNKLAFLKLSKAGLIKLGNQDDHVMKLIFDLINSMISATYIGFGFPGSNVAELTQLSTRAVFLGGSQ